MNTEETDTESILPPGRRLIIPLNICVMQGLSFVKARLLSMEIPAHVGETCPKLVRVKSDNTEQTDGSERQPERFMKIDPYRGSWGLRFLELELSNPTDVVFETSVSVSMDEPSLSQNNSAELSHPKTRIDRDYTARVLIPLEHFKLPVLDGTLLVKGSQTNGTAAGRSSSFSEKTVKAELNASIKNLISRIKVRWQSGRNSSGELNIKDAIHAALQTSVMDVLLPDPLTFGFRLAKISSDESPSPKQSDMQINSNGGSIVAHVMTPMEVLVRNNTRETIRISLNVVCKDVAGENCLEGDKATVLWEGTDTFFKLYLVFSTKTSTALADIYLCPCILLVSASPGVLTGMSMEVPPLEEIRHIFSLYFLIPGEYTMLAAAVIVDANEVLRARARATSSNEPIFCRGPPFHVRVDGTT